MDSGKKRTISGEVRTFQDQWTEEFFFVANNDKALCLFCNQNISAFKRYNLKRHYDSHVELHKLKGDSRREKIFQLKSALKEKQNTQETVSKESALIVKASYTVSNLIAKKMKPFTEGEFVKECLEQVAEILCPEKKTLFAQISLSRQSTTRRIREISQSVEEKLVALCSSFVFFSIALDESTDASDTAQVAFFIRGVNNEFQITEELASLVSLKDSTKSVDLFEAFKETLNRMNLSFQNLSGVITDGAPAMIGVVNGLAKMINDSAKQCGNFKMKQYHCIIHQENLCGGSLKMENVTEIVIKTINFIKSRALNHRQFQNFLREIDSDFSDVLYFTKVRWLSQGKMLRRFYNLRNEIKNFMTSKGKLIEELEDKDWLSDLAFMVDLTGHLNELNIRLQGKDQFVHQIFQHVVAFETKLKLWQLQLKNKNFTHFTTLNEHGGSNINKYADLIGLLIKNFESKFQDFKESEIDYKIFATPFSVDINILPENLQLECIDLQADLQLKEKFFNIPLLTFYKFHLPEEKFPELHKHALFITSLFGSTYVCEQFFSRMKLTKNKLRTRIDDENLESTLRIACTSIEPDIEKLVQGKQHQQSH